MSHTKRYERDPAKGSHATSEAGSEDANYRKSAEYVAEQTFPPFNDPAFSSVPADPPPTDPAADTMHPPKDTQYIGHPDFAQDAAANKPPKGIGNSKPIDDVEQKTRQSDSQDMNRADLRIAPAKRE